MAFTAPISVQQVLQAAFGESEKLQANNVVIFPRRATFYFWLEHETDIPCRSYSKFPLQLIYLRENLRQSPPKKKIYQGMNQTYHSLTQMFVLVDFPIALIPGKAWLIRCALRV